MQEVVSTSVPDTLGIFLFLKMLDSIGQKLILHWLHDQTEGASESLKTAWWCKPGMVTLTAALGWQWECCMERVKKPCWKTRWLYYIYDGQGWSHWQLPWGDNENLMTCGSHFVSGMPNRFRCNSMLHGKCKWALTLSIHAHFPSVWGIAWIF